MGKYLVQASYTQQATSGLVQKPEDRTAGLQELVSSLGGKLISFDYSFGDYDVVLILEMPDDTTMASFSMVAAASGAATNVKTTVLLSAGQGFEAAKKAASVTYRAPGQ
ncbi:MAG: GYD domain-containing protein [Chloroflexi bacterium]|nr:GYD domain-containing protein [Chloroflexota bacterium]